MRLYVAGPMTGLAGKNEHAFRRAENWLVDLGYEVLNPLHIDDMFNTEGERTWQWYMRHALTMLVRCDGVATLPGWAHSRGASTEVMVARRIELPVRPYWEWRGCNR